MQQWHVIIILLYSLFIVDALKVLSRREEGCTVPYYPEHGNWKFLGGEAKPGDKIPNGSVIKYECDSGYMLTTEPFLVCDDKWSSSRFPECEMLCPKPKFPRDANLRCSNREGETIDCSTAVDGSTLTYSCPRKYRKADDLDNRICIKGSWGFPKPECILECGKKVVDDSGVGAEFPWNVGIYKLNKNAEENEMGEEKYKYICGGSLVSRYVVVTAAQCVTDKSYHLQSKDDYLIGAGKLYAEFNNPRDSNAQFANITYINVHPHYKLSKGTVENIALLIASRPFSFDNFVQPLCVAEHDGFLYSDGNFETTRTMIGWRFTQGVSSEMVEAAEIDAPIITQRFRSRIRSEIIIDLEAKEGKGCEVPSHLSPHAFSVQNSCRRFKNESTCLQPEDRGKGIIVKHTGNDRYYLLGVVLYFEDATCQRFFWSPDITNFSTYIEFTTSYL